MPTCSKHQTPLIKIGHDSYLCTTCTPLPEMSVDQAVKMVHNFSGTKDEALALASEINKYMEHSNLGPMVAVNFDQLGWGCMLKGSAEFIGLTYLLTKR